PPGAAGRGCRGRALTYRSLTLPPGRPPPARRSRERRRRPPAPALPECRSRPGGDEPAVASHSLRLLRLERIEFDSPVAATTQHRVERLVQPFPEQGQTRNEQHDRE